ncbi:MAG: PilZ domain-containing protein [Desulfuromonas sp.]|nr:PilZ domain-containing protein [Desulfuromonas sp.]
MEMEERRRDKRYDTLNFVHLTQRDAGDTVLDCMGRTLDASLRGLLLEVHLPLAIGQQLSLSLGTEEDIIELSGEVVHCGESDDDMYSAGIEFGSLNAQQEEALGAYLNAFVEMKSSS